MKSVVRIATRKSPLALWQANFVKAQLHKAHPKLIIELLPLATEGDKLLTTPLAKIGGKGLFIKELEKAMLERKADLAAHSIKDIPVTLLDDFILYVCKRQDPRDALVAKNSKSLEELPKSATVGTSSLRRQSQLKALRPDIKVKNLRGNVGTRLRKLDEGQFDAIILAACGLQRLKLEERISCYLPQQTFLPSAGQGAIGIECHRNNKKMLTLLSDLEDSESRQCILAERAVSFHLGGSCQLPIAAYAELNGNQITLSALVGSTDGRTLLRCKKTGDMNQPEMIGKQAAEDLLQQGADKILMLC